MSVLILNNDNLGVISIIHKYRTNPLDSPLLDIPEILIRQLQDTLAAQAIEFAVCQGIGSNAYPIHGSAPQSSPHSHQQLSVHSHCSSQSSVSSLLEFCTIPWEKMSNAPLTPGEDPEPTSPVIDYSPITVQYNEAFENDLMHSILEPSNLNSRPQTSPPLIDPTALPIPLSSPLRTYPSPVPGILLTHPNGYHTGGPGPSPSTINEFADNFIKEYEIQDAGQLERIVEDKVRVLMYTAKDRMREREVAIQKNKDVEKQLQNLEEQRNIERRVAEKIKEDRAKRRAEKMEH